MAAVEPQQSQQSQQATQQPASRMRWYYTPQRHIDTVVFVHGILGHYVETWGEFPRLLHEDPDLPQLDILLWGYRTGLFAKHHPLATEGRHFTTHLESLIHQGRDLFLVGHSMGGIIILKGLVDRMAGNQAQKHPCCSIKWITLYASPLGGAWKARAARYIWSWVFGIKRSLDKHLRDMSKGEFITHLMAEVINRIYSPHAEDGSNRRIPIRIVAATNDVAVDAENRNAALSPYRNPPALELDENHESVKLPTHLGDVRYKALTHDLQVVFGRSFQVLCQRAIDGTATVAAREAALTEIIERHGKIIRRRLEHLVSDETQRKCLENDIVRAIVQDGAARQRPPFDTINRALITLARLKRLQ